MSTANANAWLIRKEARPGAKMRLICLAYAGGSAQMFRAWSDRFPASVEVCGYELPGRGQRIAQRPLREFAPLLEEIVSTIRPLCDRPYAFFGHCLGAMIAFEVARAFRRSGQRTPSRMFVAACRAPHIPDPLPSVANLSDEAFIEHLRTNNGTPAAFFQQPKLLKLFLPVIRADIILFENYRFTPEPPLDCPITVYGGDSDHDVRDEHLDAWRQHTASLFSTHRFPGDHFFVQSSEQPLLETLLQEIGTT